MKDRERIVTGGLVILLLILWLGFAVHCSPRFPGSLWGGALGVSGALLMLWPLLYSAVKRVRALKKAVTRRASMRVLLTWHVYTGILGGALAILHTGHKFIHPLGIFLTAAMLVSILTGYIGRHFMGYIYEELHEKERMLASIETAYHQTFEELKRNPEAALGLNFRHGFIARLRLALFVPAAEAGQGAHALASRAARLAESMADLEYAIKSHELLKRRSALWLKLHIAASLVFYILLALHVWAGVYFGLRWFD